MVLVNLLEVLPRLRVGSWKRSFNDEIQPPPTFDRARSRVVGDQGLLDLDDLACASADSVLAQPFSRHSSSPKKATVQQSQQSQWTVVLSFHVNPAFEFRLRLPGNDLAVKPSSDICQSSVEPAMRRWQGTWQGASGCVPWRTLQSPSK